MTLACQILRNTLGLIQTISDRRTMPCSICVNQCVSRELRQAYVMLDDHTCAAPRPPNICRVGVKHATHADAYSLIVRRQTNQMSSHHGICQAQRNQFCNRYCTLVSPIHINHSAKSRQGYACLLISPDCSCVQHCLSSCECLGHHNYQSSLWLEPIEGSSHIHRVHISQKT